MTREAFANSLPLGEVWETDKPVDPFDEAMNRFAQEQLLLSTLEVTPVEGDDEVISVITIRQIESKSEEQILWTSVERERQAILDGKAPSDSIFTIPAVPIDINSDQLDREARARAELRAMTSFSLKVINRLATSSFKRRGRPELALAADGICYDLGWLGTQVNQPIFSLNDFEYAKGSPIRNLNQYIRPRFGKITDFIRRYGDQDAVLPTFDVDGAIESMKLMMRDPSEVLNEEVVAEGSKTPDNDDGTHPEPEGSEAKPEADSPDLSEYPSWVLKFFHSMLPKIKDEELPPDMKGKIDLAISFESDEFNKRLARSVAKFKTTEAKLRLADYALVSYGAYLSLSRNRYGQVFGALFKDYIAGTVPPDAPLAMIKLVDAMTPADQQGQTIEAKIERVPELFRRINQAEEIKALGAYDSCLGRMQIAVDTILSAAIYDIPIYH